MRFLVSGTNRDHGMAIMSVREGLEFESQIIGLRGSEWK